MTISEFMNIAKKKNVRFYLARGEDEQKIKSYQIKKANKFLKKREMKYGDPKGEESLLNLIAIKENVDKENLIILQGSTLGVFYYFLMMSNNEDEVMLFKPYYPLYNQLSILFKKSVNYLDISKNNFEISFDFFVNNLTEKTKYVIINSPHNPTGKIFNIKEILNIINYCEKNHIYLLLDMVYEKIIYESSYSIYYKNYEYVIFLKSFSKSYNMTGCRLGYVISSTKIIEIFKQYLRNSLVSIPNIIQYIGEASLKRDNIYVLKKYKKNRNIIKDFLQTYKLEYVSLDATYYAFVKISNFNISSYDFAMDLLEKKKVAILPGIIFGNDDYIRISYMCKTKVLKKALKVISEYLSENNLIY